MALTSWKRNMEREHERRRDTQDPRPLSKSSSNSDTPFGGILENADDEDERNLKAIRVAEKSLEIAKDCLRKDHDDGTNDFNDYALVKQLSKIIATLSDKLSENNPIMIEAYYCYGLALLELYRQPLEEITKQRTCYDAVMTKHNQCMRLLCGSTNRESPESWDEEDSSETDEEKPLRAPEPSAEDGKKLLICARTQLMTACDGYEDMEGRSLQNTKRLADIHWKLSEIAQAEGDFQLAVAEAEKNIQILRDLEGDGNANLPAAYLQLAMVKKAHREQLAGEIVRDVQMAIELMVEEKSNLVARLTEAEITTKENLSDLDLEAKILVWTQKIEIMMPQLFLALEATRTSKEQAADSAKDWLRGILAKHTKDPTEREAFWISGNTNMPTEAEIDAINEIFPDGVLKSTENDWKILAGITRV